MTAMIMPITIVVNRLIEMYTETVAMTVVMILMTRTTIMKIFMKFKRKEMILM